MRRVKWRLDGDEESVGSQDVFSEAENSVMVLLPPGNFVTRRFENMHFYEEFNFSLRHLNRIYVFYLHCLHYFDGMRAHCIPGLLKFEDIGSNT